MYFLASALRRRIAVVCSLPVAAVAAVAGGGGGGGAHAPSGSAARPSILLVTLDTTRADAIGPEAQGIQTPEFNALAARGLRFRSAYATAPETLPSHSSIMTGLYPAGHGVHENGRSLPSTPAVLAERLQQGGYRTAAFVSSFVLGRRFGLARGFEVYDDPPGGRVELTAAETTDRALAFLQAAPPQPLLLWVHYFDPHAPYAPADPFRSQYADRPYLGEIAAMDAQIGRLATAFDAHAARHDVPAAFAVVGDHGEGLGDHGESRHGNLLYQSTMHVPLVVGGPGIAPGISDTPVSTRRVFHTLLDLAGLDASNSLRAAGDVEPVIGEAMKPFLEYGWQPQIMAIEGTRKAILAGTTEVYDLAADPAERRNLGSGANLSSALRKVLDDYPVPSPEAARPPATLTDDARRSLASLGYIGASAPPVVRRDAPRPADMVHLFDALERASALFVEEEYAAAIPLLRKILSEDPHNLDAALRLATAHSSLGQDAQAIDAFRRAAAIAPRSPDVRLYLALHYARGSDWPRAVPILEQVVAETPERLPALEALAAIREKQGKLTEAIALHQKINAMRSPSAADLVKLGRLAMAATETPLAIASFERGRSALGPQFRHDLELGVLYLAERRFADARAALDRVPPSHPEYPMALFKRAQVSVLLKEPDSAARIALAREHADSTTRELIRTERLFQVK